MKRQAQDNNHLDHQLPAPAQDAAGKSQKQRSNLTEEIQAMLKSSSPQERSDGRQLEAMLQYPVQRQLAAHILEHVKEPIHRHCLLEIFINPSLRHVTLRLIKLLCADMSTTLSVALPALLEMLTSTDDSNRKRGKQVLALLNDPNQHQTTQQVFESCGLEPFSFHPPAD